MCWPLQRDYSRALQDTFRWIKALFKEKEPLGVTRRLTLAQALGGERLPERRLAEPSATEHLVFGYARRSTERRFSSEGKIKRRREGNASQAPAL